MLEPSVVCLSPGALGLGVALEGGGTFRLQAGYTPTYPAPQRLHTTPSNPWLHSHRHWVLARGAAMSHTPHVSSSRVTSRVPWLLQNAAWGTTSDAHDEQCPVLGRHGLQVEGDGVGPTKRKGARSQGLGKVHTP